MPVKVKICGVRTPSIIAAAADAGADYVGLVFFPRSLRHVAPDAAKALAEAAKGRIETVAVMVDPEDALIDQVMAKVAPGMIQLHGGETPERAASIKARTGLPILKAIAVGAVRDTEEASAFAGIADMILFDSKATSATSIAGGNGVPFNWQALQNVREGEPFALSGGLNPRNVSDALAQTGAALIDVSSGVESAPGEKDADLVRQFVAAAKADRKSNGAAAS
jgi:phosphoribosylanthranilate isomerase